VDGMGCLSFRARSPPFPVAAAASAVAGVPLLQRSLAAVAGQQDWPPEVSSPVCVMQSLVDKLSVVKIASRSATASPPPSDGGVCSERSSSGERSVNIAATGGGRPEDVVTVAFAGPGPEPVWEK